MDTLRIPLENLYSKTHSMYKLVVLASMRALELNAGAAKLTLDGKKDVLQTSLLEIVAGKISYAQLASKTG